MTWLGGELRGEGERDLAQHEGRVLFLECIEETAPDVLEALRDDALPVYVSAYENTEPDPYTVEPRGPSGVPVERQDPPDWIHYRWEGTEQDQRTEPPQEVREALTTWACRFNLEARWFLGAALRTLGFWKHARWNARPEGNAETSLRFAEPHFVDSDYAPELELPPYRGWHPRWESWADYEKGAKNHFRAEARNALPRYRKKRLREERVRALPDGLPRGVQKRGDPKRHFRWFVRFQVLEETLESIAAGSVEINTVQRALRNVEELIGLTRRSL